MASQIESSTSADSGNLSMATLAKNLDRTLTLFGQVLMTPAFREDRVRLAVNKSIEAIRRQYDDPKAIADRELRKAVYAGHPLGWVPTVASVKKIGRDDLVAFHRALLPSQQHRPGRFRRFPQRRTAGPADRPVRLLEEGGGSLSRRSANRSPRCRPRSCSSGRMSASR